MTVQIAGPTFPTGPAAVESSTQAIRTSIRPNDFGSLGVYAVAAGNSTNPMTAGLAAGSAIFSFRWNNANVCLIKKINFSVSMATGPASVQVPGVFNFVVERSFSVSDSGGTSILPATNTGKLKTTMATTKVTDIRIAAAGALTAGTKTPDASPFASLSAPWSTTSNIVILPNTVVWQASAGDYPLIFTNTGSGEGFNITATVPSLGAWNFGVGVVWEELAAYS